MEVKSGIKEENSAKDEDCVIEKSNTMEENSTMKEKSTMEEKSTIEGNDVIEENREKKKCNVNVTEGNLTKEKNAGICLCYDRDNLYSLMRTCGRYLHLRSCKGAGQGRILAILLARGKMTQKELQDILQIQPGSISEILAKLEGKGFIRRSKDDEDKRRSILELTEAGEKLARFQEKQEDGRPAFGALTEAEQEELKKLLGKLLEDWLGNQNLS